MSSPASRGIGIGGAVCAAVISIIACAGVCRAQVLPDLPQYKDSKISLATRNGWRAEDFGPDSRLRTQGQKKAKERTLIADLSQPSARVGKFEIHIPPVEQSEVSKKTVANEVANRTKDIADSAASAGKLARYKPVVFRKTLAAIEDWKEFYFRGTKAVGNWDFSTGESMPRVLLVGIYTPVENVGFFLNRPYLWFKDPVLKRTGVYFAVHNVMFWKLPSPTQEMLKLIHEGKDPWHVPLQATVKVFQNTRRDEAYRHRSIISSSRTTRPPDLAESGDARAACPKSDRLSNLCVVTRW